MYAYLVRTEIELHISGISLHHIRTLSGSLFIVLYEPHREKPEKYGEPPEPPQKTERKTSGMIG